MTITDDIIKFEADDFAGFSEPVKKALAEYLENYATYFASIINVSVAASLQHAKNLAASDPAISVVLEGYAAADAAKRASAESLLTELDNLLKAS